EGGEIGFGDGRPGGRGDVAVRHLDEQARDERGRAGEGDAAGQAVRQENLDGLQIAVGPAVAEDHRRAGGEVVDVELRVGRKRQCAGASGAGVGRAGEAGVEEGTVVGNEVVLVRPGGGDRQRLVWRVEVDGERAVEVGQAGRRRAVLQRLDEQF